MTIDVDGCRYYSPREVMEMVGISRQTLWRWRRQGKIPPGHRFRDRRLVFSVGELETIQRFVNRIEPVAAITTGTGDFNGPAMEESP